MPTAALGSLILGPVHILYWAKIDALHLSVATTDSTNDD